LFGETTSNLSPEGTVTRWHQIGTIFKNGTSKKCKVNEGERARALECGGDATSYKKRSNKGGTGGFGNRKGRKRKLLPVP